jgi:hypothetical protein
LVDTKGAVRCRGVACSRSYNPVLLTAMVNIATAAAESVKFAVTDIEGLETPQQDFGPFRDLVGESTKMKLNTKSPATQIS